ncbi:hypothetical protein DPEC_G00211730 [Dallia pectoralis]|uniref:Uncharacterized protein n=1 Tax=Dallia pectoralis TaxID=75939 RepID=A0ACC2G5Q2_DALPE|nr:hypothetical protein DPEC_G00211730 [Dallia pectoralis]
MVNVVVVAEEVAECLFHCGKRRYTRKVEERACPIAALRSSSSLVKITEKKTGYRNMVFLSLSCWIRSRGPDRYWKVQEVLSHARHFRGRKSRCYSLAVRAVRRAFVYATKGRKLKRRNMRTLWISRIAAASREHGMKYPVLIHNLIKSSVQVNRRVLSDLAITEPKSFLALAKLARARQQEGFAVALGDRKEPPGVFSRIVTLQ